MRRRFESGFASFATYDPEFLPAYGDPCLLQDHRPMAMETDIARGHHSFVHWHGHDGQRRCRRHDGQRRCRRLLWLVRVGHQSGTKSWALFWLRANSITRAAFQRKKTGGSRYFFKGMHTCARRLALVQTAKHKAGSPSDPFEGDWSSERLFAMSLIYAWKELTTLHRKDRDLKRLRDESLTHMKRRNEETSRLVCHVLGSSRTDLLVRAILADWWVRTALERRTAPLASPELLL